jgi:hypothetical protein
MMRNGTLKRNRAMKVIAAEAIITHCGALGG